MQPIIRRTITITITETWTITWADGREMVWHETHDVVSPADSTPDESLPMLTDDDASENDMLDPAVAEPTVADEEDAGLPGDFLSS